MKRMIEILRGLREDSDLKQSDIAGLIGTTQQQYSKYETGESDLPIQALAILADYYQVSADYLLGRTESREGLAALDETIVGGSTAGGFCLSCCLCGQAGGGPFWNMSICSSSSKGTVGKSEPAAGFSSAFGGKQPRRQAGQRDPLSSKTVCPNDFLIKQRHNAAGVMPFSC